MEKLRAARLYLFNSYYCCTRIFQGINKTVELLEIVFQSLAGWVKNKILVLEVLGRE